jgi:hypothetical protein
VSLLALNFPYSKEKSTYICCLCQVHYVLKENVAHTRNCSVASAHLALPLPLPLFSSVSYNSTNSPTLIHVSIKGWTIDALVLSSKSPPPPHTHTPLKDTKTTSDPHLSRSTVRWAVSSYRYLALCTHTTLGSIATSYTDYYLSNLKMKFRYVQPGVQKFSKNPRAT